jgi:hypothetical protein
MKTLLPALFLVLAGCHTPPAPEPMTAAPSPPPTVVTAPESSTELLRQRQLVEALMSQNEALQAQLQDVRIAPVGPGLVQAPAQATDTAAPAPEAEPPPSTWLTPNEEGVIDLRTAIAQAAGTSINPFVIREPAGPGEETLLSVQGIVRGEHPCALVNDRVLTVNDRVGRLQLERIEPDSLFFRWDEFFLKIPLHGGPVRVRHP